MMCYLPTPIREYSMMRHPTDIVQVKLRIPEHLRRSIEKKAKKAGLTMNAQLVQMLVAADKEESATLRDELGMMNKRILDVLEAALIKDDKGAPMKREDLAREFEIMPLIRKKTDQSA
jgi:hypothetical protein